MTHYIIDFGNGLTQQFFASLADAKEIAEDLATYSAENVCIFAYDEESAVYEAI